MTRKRLGAACAIVLALLLTLTACSGGKDAVSQGSSQGNFNFVTANSKGTVIAVAKRKLAGPLQGQLINGGDYALSADKGHVVVLNFFASWCGPCQNETPNFDTVYRDYKAAGVKFVGMDVKDPSKSASQSWLQDKNITFPVVYDEEAKSAIQLGNVPLNALPSTIVIDKQGKVAAVYVASLLPQDLTPVITDLNKET